MINSIKFIEEEEDLAEIWADALKENDLVFTVPSSVTKGLWKGH